MTYDIAGHCQASYFGGPEGLFIKFNGLIGMLYGEVHIQAVEALWDGGLRFHREWVQVKNRFTEGTQ